MHDRWERTNAATMRSERAHDELDDGERTARAERDRAEGLDREPEPEQQPEPAEPEPEQDDAEPKPEPAEPVVTTPEDPVA